MEKIYIPNETGIHINIYEVVDKQVVKYALFTGIKGIKQIY